MKQTTSNKKSPNNKLEHFLNSGKTHRSNSSKSKAKKTTKKINYFKSKSWFEFLAK